ncbi:MAG: 4-(cytidine 5'-diphospho)-2-C-methyl-D-erythritol kinase [Ideonella sp.]|nr:MAG: 4-(cytidine 5'-diphospho)-2-C-methyl-D-erythritol kinase [Burkholderiaceae bacterium]MBE7424459.1 4-(cytidine 5'-diphospho)-2-C-methyl-D-erythritol kinase [Ideonella sp.]
MKALYDLAAPAKVNLFLHVVGRRADGYHLLQSVFVLIDWADTLHFERRDDAALHRHDLSTPLPADDLCLRAARALQHASNCPLGADIHIDKRVPAGAGLGGGSSDAATTLLALNRLWGLHWPLERLAALALTLGADVPFFVHGRNAFVQGVGEQITPIDLPALWLAVVKPAASLATAAVFASPDLERSTPAVILRDFLADTQLSDCAAEGFGRNDLQPVAQRECPEVGQAVRWLQQRFGNGRMSGSGSAVFARAGTGDRPQAHWAPQELAPQWVGRMCRSLAVHPLLHWPG